MLVTLPYTLDMQQQDALCATEDEDTKKMFEYYEVIEKAARDQGFIGILNKYEYNGEALIELFKNKKELEEAQLGLYEDYETCGTCRCLVQKLLKMMREV